MLAVITSNYATPDSNTHHRYEHGGYQIEQSYGPSPQQQNLKAWSGLPQASAQQVPKQSQFLDESSITDVMRPAGMRRRQNDRHADHVGDTMDRYRCLPRCLRGPTTASTSPRCKDSPATEKSKHVIRRLRSAALPTPDNLKHSHRSPMETSMVPKNVQALVETKTENEIQQVQSEDKQVQPEDKQVQQQPSRGIPMLISEKHRRAAFVEKLVDTAALMIEFVWSNFTINPSAKIIPLRVFLQETLRHSHTSYSTLQTALFYLFRIKPKITERAFRSHRPPTPPAEGSTAGWNANQNNDPATCGRRMFLAALIVASKYLQDQSYNNKAWSTISGLTVQEINANEMEFLQLIDYNLFIGEDIFKRWNGLLLSHIQAISGFDVKNGSAFAQEEYQREKERFFRETLRNLDPKTMACTQTYPWTPDSSYPGSPL